jgi:hypothetical protein
MHVDRVSCAWLIRRFIDADAEFIFIESDVEPPGDATPFDIRGVELSHHNGDCSFETILRRYEIDDAMLWRMAEVVHEADIGDELFDAPEAAGLNHIVRGMGLITNDHALLETTRPILDGLYAWFRAELEGNR